MKTKIIAGVVLAAAGAAWWWLAGPVMDKPKPAADATPAKSAAPAPPAQNRAAATASGPVTVRTPADSTRWAALLPAAALPLGETLPALKAAAAEGNAVAACRLAVQLNRCREAIDLESRVLRGEEFLKRFGDPAQQPRSYAEMVEKDRKHLAELKPLCASVPAEELGHAWQYSLAAAQSGLVPAMVGLAVQPPLDSHKFLAHMDEWDQYRQAVPALLEHAVQAGDRRAIEWMALLLAGEPVERNAGFTLPPNPERALSLYLLLDKLPESKFVARVPGRMERLVARVGPQGVQRAAGAADSLFQAQFAGRGELRPLGEKELDDHGAFCEANIP